MKTDTDKVRTISLVLAGEAASEGAQGMIAVSCVISNRMQRRKRDAFSIVTQTKQFSAYEDLDMCQRNLVDVFPITEPLAMALFFNSFRHLFTDITNGADHYVTTKLFLSVDRPKWIDDMVQTVVIGGHTFLRSKNVGDV